MTLTLYTCTSDANKVQKDLTEIASLTGTLKDAVSILNPTILIESDNAELFTTCNYAYIPEFGRYYFVNNITIQRQGLYQLTMRVDVLQTYAAYILSLEAVISRQEFEYNLYLNDPCFKVEQRTKHKIKNFPNSFTAAEFVLAVAGAGDTSS